MRQRNPRDRRARLIAVGQNLGLELCAVTPARSRSGIHSCPSSAFDGRHPRAAVAVKQGGMTGRSRWTTGSGSTSGYDEAAEGGLISFPHEPLPWAVKRRTRPMLGFKDVHYAAKIIARASERRPTAKSCPQRMCFTAWLSGLPRFPHPQAVSPPLLGQRPLPPRLARQSLDDMDCDHEAASYATRCRP